MTDKKQAVILAGGRSSRFWPFNNQRHKCQINIFGQPLIYWTVEGLARQNIKDIVVIVRPDCIFRPALDSLAKKMNLKITFVVQSKPLGTGRALSLAEKYIKHPFFVLWPYRIDAGAIIEQMTGVLKKTGHRLVLTALKTDSPWLFGMLKINKGQVVEIVEKPPKGREPSSLKVLGAYFLQPDFFNYYKKLKKHHSTDYVDALNLYLKDQPAGFIRPEKDFPELKYPWDVLKFMAEKLSAKNFQSRFPNCLKKGKNVVIRGKVFFGKNVSVGDNTIIQGPCYIGDNCRIGTNCLLRGPLNLEAGVMVGALAEMKNCLVQENTHFHSGYCGDSVIGRHCRFGAGFITANRRLDRQTIKAKIKNKKVDSGLTYLGACIGDNVCCGIHGGTMPGVLIGANSIIGPGSMVFENLKENSFFFVDFKKTGKIR